MLRAHIHTYTYTHSHTHTHSLSACLIFLETKARCKCSIFPFFPSLSSDSLYLVKVLHPSPHPLLFLQTHTHTPTLCGICLGFQNPVGTNLPNLRWKKEGKRKQKKRENPPAIRRCITSRVQIRKQENKTKHSRSHKEITAVGGGGVSSSIRWHYRDNPLETQHSRSRHLLPFEASRVAKVPPHSVFLPPLWKRTTFASTSPHLYLTIPLHLNS